MKHCKQAPSFELNCITFKSFGISIKSATITIKVMLISYLIFGSMSFVLNIEKRFSRLLLKNCSNFGLDLQIRKWVMIFSYFALSNGGISTIHESCATMDEDLDFRNVMPSANTSRFIESLSCTLVQ